MLKRIRHIFYLLLSMLLVCSSVSCNRHKQEETIRTEENRKMDMIMWYDCDGWVSSMTFNPNHPEKPKVACRVADTYFGKYSKLTEEIALQHAYWISAIGSNVICCDWTNYISYRQPGNNISYNKQLYTNTDTLLSTLDGNQTFDVPNLYVAIRLSDYKYDELKMKLDDVYALYEKHRDSWYYFDDGTEQASKPFIVIFTDVFFDGTKWYDRLHNTWREDLMFYEDERFNIRWSNGYLGVTTKQDKNGWFKISGDLPYWTFVEPYLDEAAGEGYYEVMYKEGNGRTIEQMSCWAAMFSENKYWDSLNNEVNGQTTFERTLRGAAELKPKALLINRFNYPLAWPEEPQEGVSLYESVHIEPNKNFGFSVFDNVRKNLYELNGWGKTPVKCEVISNDGKTIKVSLNGYPTEYRISVNSDMLDSDWEYLNISEWIQIPENMEGDIYVQLRNGFGESNIIKL